MSFRHQTHILLLFFEDQDSIKMQNGSEVNVQITITAEIRMLTLKMRIRICTFKRLD